MVQIKATGCTRLELRKDVRLDVNETWAIKEGSLVIAIQENYTHLPSKKEDDEFGPKFGEVFVVCRMYPDMWALCARLSFHSPVITDGTGAVIRGWENIRFLPLCAVTLAANFENFEGRRARAHTTNPQKPFSGGGLLLEPPRRSHSVKASKEIFNCEQGIRLRLPSIVQELCSGFSEVPKGEYVPLDDSKAETTTEENTAREDTAPYTKAPVTETIEAEKSSGTLRRTIGKLRRSISRRVVDLQTSETDASKEKGQGATNSERSRGTQKVGGRAVD